jgi:hypothetical protein
LIPSLFPSYALYELTADPESLPALPASAENGAIKKVKRTVSLAALGHRLAWQPMHRRIPFQERTALGTKIHLPHGTGRHGYR